MLCSLLVSLLSLGFDTLFTDFNLDSAEKFGQIDLQIDWLRFALKLMKTNENTKGIKKVMNKLNKAEEIHDRFVLTEGIARQKHHSQFHYHFFIYFV